ncbi:MAG: Mu transposase C-terminal domain-containing protein [Lentisphaeria bacterium]|nr:Mu transposase C-terminal domain-containing protein [Lentisphaeria bacterium]
MGILAYLAKRNPVVGTPTAALSVPSGANPPAPTPVRETCRDAALPADVRAVARERAHYIGMVDEAAVTRRLSKPDAALWVATNYAECFPNLTRGGHHGASTLTFSSYKNWKRKLAKDGTLADNYRRGAQPVKGDERFWNLFYGMFLNQNRLPLAQAYKLAARKMKELDPTVPVPSICAARLAASRLDPAAVILAREGESAFKNRCMDFIRRDWTDVAPGECVIGDSRTFDTRVRIWDDGKQAWIGVRPTITGLLDARSWFFGAYWITAEPVNAGTLIDTLALYLHNTGGVPPRYAYFDNGKDYTARGYSTPFEAGGKEHSIFGELGITLITALPFNARAKTIERAFRDMMQQFDKAFPDYLGSKPTERTMGAAYFDKHPEELPSLEQFCQVFASWLETWHHTPKRGELHAGKTPAEMWGARPVSAALAPEELRFALLQPVALRKVGRGPAVSYGNELYYCDALHFGQEVLLKTDRLDERHVYVFTPEGALLGEARTRDRIKALALDDEAARIAIADQLARQRRQLKNARTYLSELSGGGCLASPLELFLGAGGELEHRGDVGSVKGASHHYRRIGVAGVDFAAPSAPAPAALPGPEKSVTCNTPETTPETAAEFDSFMRHRRPEEWEE